MSFCLIGEDSLLIQCGNILLAKNYSIELVISPLKNIQDWAQKNNILFMSNFRDIKKRNLKTVDYILSVVNSHILSESILRLSRHGAINYHDSPLPKYAGLNATSWAIINDEKIHGVSWHLMTEKIDEGDILRQCIFPINEHETALSLNLKCYEKAIESFRELIIDIEEGNLSLKKQNLTEKSYYGIDHALPNFGFIDWQNFSAELLTRMNRSLLFGHYDNNIGSLKLYLQTSYVIVSHIETVDFVHAFNPGTVVALEKSALYISTVTAVIKIEKLISQTGVNLTINEFVKKYGVTVGYQFPVLNENDLHILQEFHSIALRNEKFWINKIKEVSDHATFTSKNINKHKKINAVDSVINLRKIFPNKNIITQKNLLLSAILIYLFRLNNHEKISVSIVNPDYNKLHNSCGNLFSTYLPLLFELKQDSSLQDAMELVSESMMMIDKNKLYLNDIVARHSIESIYSNIIINSTNDLTDISLPADTTLYFQLDEQQGIIKMSHCLDLSAQGGMHSEVITNLTQHLVKILIGLINNPHMCATSFCFLTEVEKQKLLKIWGRGERRSQPSYSISSLFDKQVKLRPNNPAIFMGDKVVSYQQLWEASEKIAGFIRSKNLPSQLYIGIYFTRSMEMLAVILGILKANAVYVPLDTKYPLLKISNIIKEANLSWVFTQEGFIEKLASFFNNNKLDVQLFCSETILTDYEQSLPVTEQCNDNLLEKLAYIMFTSGTTGTPKGVMVTEKNVLNYCNWFLESTQFDDNSTIDFSSSIAFDLSVPCTIAPLLAGGSIAICEESQKINPEEYLYHLQKQKITHVETTPGYLELLLNYPDEIRKLCDLKYLLLGADVVPTIDVMRWLTLCPQHQVINEYGPTETTVSATSYFVRPDQFLNESSIPIGRPAINTQCYVLDKYNNLCPIGVKGELYIGGEQVAKGYLNKPEMTKEKFLPSNVNKFKEIIYKTGDMACWLPDGNLHFFGRNDHQVKIHGYRIELTEIESALVKIPAVSQAVVVLQEGNSKEKYLRAYLVCENKITSNHEIRKFLSFHLPNYMIPKEFCVIDSIPLKENEKIDFARLEKLEKQNVYFLSSETKSGIEKITNFEKVIQTIWQGVFNLPSIHNQDDFFDMGGDSLMALQIITELKDYYLIDLPLQTLFEYPTISLLSKEVCKLYSLKNNPTSASMNNQTTSLIQLSKGVDETPLFLVHPVGGSVFWYKQLASYFEGKYTIYGIQDQNLDGNHIKFGSLEEMAAYYLSEIKKVYSGENYYLGGASFGSTVAFEMAHQLLKSKKKIGFLGLFDGWAEYPTEIMQKSTFDLLSYNFDNYQKICQKTNERLIELERYRKELLVNYKLSILNSDVTLFKAAEVWETFQSIDDFYNGWQPFIKGKITVYKVPGDHSTMFVNPNVPILAECLKQQWETAREEFLNLQVINETG